jgi:hypothetical protein
MVIRLVIDFGELVKVALKRGVGGKRGVWVVEEEWRLLVFWPLCVLGVFLLL